MKRPVFIARLSGKPTGPLGWLIAQVMAHETASLNEALLAILRPRPADHVLEIGFGHGRTIARLAERVTDGRVCGIDHSAAMVRLARRHNRDGVEQGRVDLRLGDSASLPFAHASIDSVLAVHTIYFWERPESHLGECFRVLRPGGRLLLGYRADDDGTFPKEVYRFYDRPQVMRLLAASGFDLRDSGHCDGPQGRVDWTLATVPTTP